jgi:hypothetical protein
MRVAALVSPRIDEADEPVIVVDNSRQRGE